MKHFSPFDRSRRKGDDDVQTPKSVYEALDREFHFTFDPCPPNPAGLRLRDGLGDWGERNYVNPPYSKKTVWIKKAIEEQKKGHLTVMLLPVDTSTRWFHDLVLPYAEIRWLRGRIRFYENQKESKSPAKFASMICVFRPKQS